MIEVHYARNVVNIFDTLSGLEEKMQNALLIITGHHTDK